jgi:cold shock CspA family protein
MKKKGKIVRWNEDRGFGFIAFESTGEELFIHVTALKHRSRNPIVGDVILFDVVAQRDGKLRADNAEIEGDIVKPVNNPIKKRSLKRANSPLDRVLYILGVVAVFYLYQTLSSDPLPMPAALNELFKKQDSSNKLFIKQDSPSFSCLGKQHCSQMVSCKEAKFYLKNCPNVKIDGDHDGVPCERQLCN